MGLHYVVWLVVAVLLATVDAASSRNTTAEHQPLARHGNIVRRFLRTDNDDERGVSFKGFPGLDKMVTFANTKRIARWLKNGKTADAAFKKMQLGRVGEKLFASPRFLTWISYVDDFNAKYPEKATSMIPTLVAQYSEAGLTKMLEAAKRTPGTESAVLKVEDALTLHWAAVGKVLDDAFALLRLDQAGRTVFDKPLFSTWVNYVTSLERENPGMKSSVITSLRIHYSDDDIARMIKEAMKHQSTVRIARVVQSESWLHAKKSPEDIFTLLKLDKAGNKLLVSSRSQRWGSYVDDFNARFPEQQVMTLDVIRTKYSDEALAQLLVAGRSVSTTKDSATSMQISLLNKWLGEKKEPAIVSRLLSLDSSNPMMQAYSSKFLATWGNAV